MVKKIVSALLAAVMLIALLAGCSGKNNLSRLSVEASDGRLIFNLTAEEFKTELNNYVKDDQSRKIGTYASDNYNGQYVSSYSYPNGVEVVCVADEQLKNLKGVAWTIDASVPTPDSDVFGRNISASILLLDPALSGDDGKAILEELHLMDMDSWSISSKFETIKNNIKYTVSSSDNGAKFTVSIIAFANAE